MTQGIVRNFIGYKETYENSNIPTALKQQLSISNNKIRMLNASKFQKFKTSNK